MKQFKQQLFELLTIQAPSGQEAKVRNYLQPKLAELVDAMHVDAKGNLLAEKVCGDGKGVTVLLSAHMDSVRNIQKGRQVIEKDGAFYSTKGVLGADDRAGIAIIMTVLRNIDKSGFNGTLKIAFTVEEEIGCVGSSAMDVNWYKDAALAIVVDRRGNRDIVTGCGTPYNFCSEKVGKFFEDCSALQGMDWKAVGGGISDAMTFSSNGVHSVNLSAGYRNEHTEKEYVVIEDCMDTVRLILQALNQVNLFAHTFGEVPQEAYFGRANRYSSYSYGGWTQEDWDYYFGIGAGAGTSLTSTSASHEASDRFEEVTIFEQSDNSWGNVSLTDIGGYMSIYQETNGKYKSQEIWMSRSDFNEMVNAYLAHRGLPSMEELLRAKAQFKKEQAKAKAAARKQAKKGKKYTTDKQGALVQVQ